MAFRTRMLRAAVLGALFVVATAVAAVWSAVTAIVLAATGGAVTLWLVQSALIALGVRSERRDDTLP